MGSLENSQELSLTERLSEIARNTVLDKESPYNTIRVDADLYEDIRDHIDRLKADNGTLFRLRPSKENDSIEAAISAWQALHDPEVDAAFLGRFKSNVSPSFSHELWYDDGFVRFHSYQPDSQADRFESKFRAKYPNVTIERPERRYPEINQGDYISAATVHTEREFWYPIKSPLTESGDETSVKNEDPYGDIATSMVLENATFDGERLEPDDFRAIVQIVAQPARPCWTQDTIWGKNLRDVAAKLTSKDIEVSMTGAKREIQPGEEEKNAARIIRRQRDIKGFYVTLRVIGISPHQELARERTRDVAEDYRKYFESFTLQGLAPDPLAEDQIYDHFSDSLLREHEFTTFDRMTRFNPQKFLITAHGFGSLAHLPNNEINAPGIDWATMDTGPGAPPDTTQIDSAASDDKQDRQDDTKSTDIDDLRGEWSR